MPQTFSEGSRYARRVRQRYALDLEALAPGLPQEAHLRRALEALQKTYSLAEVRRELGLDD